jgi:hypothetical protein
MSEPVVLIHDRHPEVVLSVIDVEGNFTLKDAFWSAKIAEMEAAEAEALLESFREDPAGWLSRNGIGPVAKWLGHSGFRRSARHQHDRPAWCRAHDDAGNPAEFFRIISSLAGA